MKLNYGTVANNETGKEEDVNVGLSKMTSVGAFIVGGLSITFGIFTLVFSAFRRGGERAMNGEWDALARAGVVEADEDPNWIKSKLVK